MEIGHNSGATTADDMFAPVTLPFTCAPGRTLYMIPFTDAEEEIAWDQAVAYREHRRQ